MLHAPMSRSLARSAAPLTGLNCSVSRCALTARVASNVCSMLASVAAGGCNRWFSSNHHSVVTYGADKSEWGKDGERWTCECYSIASAGRILGGLGGRGDVCIN